MRLLLIAVVWLFLVGLISSTTSIPNSFRKNGQSKITRANLQVSSKNVSIAKSINISSRRRKELAREMRKTRTAAIRRYKDLAVYAFLRIFALACFLSLFPKGITAKLFDLAHHLPNLLADPYETMSSDEFIIGVIDVLSIISLVSAFHLIF